MRYGMSSGKVSTGALAAGSVKSMILLNPLTNDGRLIEIWLSFGAIVEQVDIAAELYRVTTLGSPGGTTGTAVKEAPGSVAAQWTGLTALTTEPTAVERLRDFFVPTRGGLVPMYFPLGREVEVAGGGARIGFRILNDGASTMTAINCRADLGWAEGGI